jgi:hypothetical protein
MRNNVKPDELISQVEAARIRGVSKQAIANLISRGRLETITIAGRILLFRTQVESFVALPNTGRPPKKKAPVKATKKSPRKKTASE